MMGKDKPSRIYIDSDKGVKGCDVDYSQNLQLLMLRRSLSFNFSGLPDLPTEKDGKPSFCSEFARLQKEWVEISKTGDRASLDKKTQEILEKIASIAIQHRVYDREIKLTIEGYILEELNHIGLVKEMAAKLGNRKYVLANRFFKKIENKTDQMEVLKRAHALKYPKMRILKKTNDLEFIISRLHDVDFEVMQLALDRLEELKPDEIEKWIFHTHEWNDSESCADRKIRCMERINDPNLMIRIIEHFRGIRFAEKIRIAAMNRLENEELVFQLGKMDDDHEFKIAVKKRLKLRSILPLTLPWQEGERFFHTPNR